MVFVQVQLRTPKTSGRYFVGLTGRYRLQLRAWAYQAPVSTSARFITLRSEALRIAHGAPELSLFVGAADMVRAAMPWLDADLDGYIDVELVDEGTGDPLASSDFIGMNLYFEAIPAS